jgi:hypothetical protein
MRSWPRRWRAPAIDFREGEMGRMYGFDTAAPSWGALLALTLLAGSSGLARADDDPVLDARQQSATAAINEAGKIERAYGYLDTAAHEYVVGDGGVLPRGEAWLADAYAWVGDLKAVTGVLAIADERTFVDAVATVEHAYADAAVALADLDARAERIAAASRRASELLERVDGVPAVTDPFQEPVASLVHDTRDAARDGAARVAGVIAERRTAMHALLTQSRPLLIGRLKSAMVAAGLARLEPRLQQAADALAYSDQALPLVRELEAIEARLGRLATDLAYHQAADAHQLGEQACAAFEGRLAAVQTSTGLRQRAMDRKAVVCAAIAGHWSDLAALGRSAPELVFEYARQKQAIYRQQCRTEHPAVNCEKVAVLSAVPLPALQAMDAAHLKFYETAWSEANLSL